MRGRTFQALHRTAASMIAAPLRYRAAIAACFVIVTVLPVHGSSQTGAVGCRPPGTAALSRVMFSVPASPPPPSSSTPAPAPAPTGRPDGAPRRTRRTSNSSAALVFPPGTWARYSCDPGYVMVGDGMRTCLQDGKWTGSIPRCYLNVAEHSSLAAAHSPLTDGDMTTSGDLLTLFEGGRALMADLYFVFPLIEMRLVTIYNLTGMSIQVRLSENNVSWIGFSMQLDAPQRPKPDVQGLVVHTLSLQNTLLKNGARFVRVSLFHSSGAYFKRASFSPVWPLHELQIVAQSTGLSRHQCLDDLGRPNIAATWAAGDRCYHLVSARASRSEAEEECHRLGAEGALFRDTSPGLHDMVVDILRYRRILKLARTSDVWTGGKWNVIVRNAGPSPFRVPSSVRPERCLAVRRRSDWKTVQVSCDARFRFVCQRAPRLCGSPPQRPSLIYKRARPTLDGGGINVTCVDPQLTSGHIQCRQRSWTQPSFCDPRPRPPAPKPTSSVHEVKKPPTSSGTAAPKTSPGETVPATKKYLGAIIGGVVGGSIVLAVIAALLICNSRKKDEKLTHEPYNFMEFWGLGQNPIYKSDEEDHVYSEVGSAEAIYEEPRFSSGQGKTRPSIRPPPLPQPRPSVGTLETVVGHDDESDYEICSTWDTKAESRVSPAPRSDQRPDAPECSDDVHREVEYSVPFAAPNGRASPGHESNSSLDRASTDGRTSAPPARAMSDASEHPYALPYDLKADETSGAGATVQSRESVPDVAVLTVTKHGEAAA